MNKANVSHLTEVFYVSLFGAKADHILNRGRQGTEDLRGLLRHHDEEIITVEETWKRDAIDYLLAYYGMLELALIGGAIADLRDDIRASALRNLTNVHLKQYYEKHYPLLLPQLLLRRLCGDLCITDSRANIEVFAEFVTLTHHFEADTHIETFLWFLDGGYRGGYDMDDVIKALKRPRICQHSIGQPPDKLDELGFALHGFRKFLRFSVHFHTLLEDNLNSPLFAAAMYHQHGYWFKHLSKELEGSITRAVKAVIASSTGEGAKSANAEMKLAAKAVRDLCKGKYGKPLTDLHPMVAACDSE